jgi:hypothetical protein
VSFTNVENEMSFFSHFLGIVNWKTTLAGALGLLATLSSLIPALAPYRELILTLVGTLTSAGLLGAKDGNVTGGSVPATMEAQARSVSSPIP